QPAPAKPPPFLENCGGLKNLSIPRPLRGIHDAAFPGTPLCWRVLPGCASKSGRVLQPVLCESPVNRVAGSRAARRPDEEVTTLSFGCNSSMAHSAIPQLAQPLSANLVVRDQFAASLNLIGWRFPFHIEDLVLGPNLLFRGLMAIQAPAHVQGV